MAKVKITGHASGTGVITVTAPNTSTDRTLTLPDSTGTILDNTSTLDATKLSGNLPAISAASLTNVPLRPNASPLIINGAMQVAQRGTSHSHANSNTNAFTVDRLNINTGSIGEYTSTQESLTSGAAFEAGFKNAARIDCTTADASPASGDYFYAEYKIEAQDCSSFKKGTSAAETMTVAFWVKSNKTGTGQLNVRDTDNNRMCSGTYVISVANTWEHKVINIAADTTGAIADDNGIGYLFEFWLGSGTAYSSGTAPTAWETRVGSDRNGNGTLNINDNTANDWAITGLQVEVGTYTAATLPPFQHRSYGEELALCQRYWSQSATLSGLTGAFVFTAFNTNEAWGGNHFPVTMRATPTVTIYNNGGTSGGCHKLGSPDVTGVSAGTISTTGVAQITKSSGFTADDLYACTYTASAEL